jgi:hypothetical protein
MPGLPESPVAGLQHPEAEGLQPLHVCLAGEVEEDVLRIAEYVLLEDFRAPSVVESRYAVPSGSMPSDHRPRSISAFACSSEAAASAIVGRIFNCETMKQKPRRSGVWVCVAERN